MARMADHAEIAQPVEPPLPSVEETVEPLTADPAPASPPEGPMHASHDAEIFSMSRAEEDRLDALENRDRPAGQRRRMELLLLSLYLFLSAALIVVVWRHFLHR